MPLQSFFNSKPGSGLSKLGGMLQTSVGLGGSTLSPIAIDFGTGAMKLVQVENNSTPQLVAAACLDTPLDLLTDHTKRLAFQLEALPKLLKKSSFKGKRAVCAIPAWCTTCKHLQFTRDPSLPLAAMVEGAIRQQLGVEPSSLVYRFVEVSAADKPGKVDVVLLSVGREIVNHLMGAMTAAKLEPVGIHSEFLCILRAFDYIHRREGDINLNSLYLDLGASTTKLLISHGRELAFARMINVGGHQLDQAIAQQLALTEGEAKRKRLDTDLAVPPSAFPNPGPAVTPPTPTTPAGQAQPSAQDRRGVGIPVGLSADVSQQPAVAVGPEGSDLREPLETITDEVKLCVRYHASQFPSRKIERVVFIGGESRHRGLVQHIARALRLPAQVADPLARLARTGGEPVIGVDMKMPQPGWAVAMGLCMTPTDL